jgi:hypothetical protein
MCIPINYLWKHYAFGREKSGVLSLQLLDEKNLIKKERHKEQHQELRRFSYSNTIICIFGLAGHLSFGET